MTTNTSSGLPSLTLVSNVQLVFGSAYINIIKSKGTPDMVASFLLYILCMFSREIDFKWHL